MLFVSRKDPRTTETLPDTSLHNVRACSAQQGKDCSCSSSNSASFVPLEKACLPKLTKEQFDLHREFLRLGAALMAQNADLFHQALTLLSAQHNLKVATPATSISDIIPRPRPAQRGQGSDASAAAAAVAGNSSAAGSCVAECDDFVAPRASFRKYVLPKEYAEKEFYQCMECKERRSANSFGAVHTHGAARPNIRCHCPICDSFLAVTHRGYHLKSRHSDVVTTTAQHQQQAAEPASSLKRGRDACSDEDKCETALYSPAEKVRPLMCDSPSTCSAVSEDSSCRSSLEEAPDTECSLFVAADQPSFSPSSSEQSTGFVNPLFAPVDGEEEPFQSRQQSSLFSLGSEENFLVGAPTSPFSY